MTWISTGEKVVYFIRIDDSSLITIAYLSTHLYCQAPSDAEVEGWRDDAHEFQLA